MKKILGLLIATALVVAVIGCAKPEEGDPAATAGATAGTAGATTTGGTATTTTG